jgi:CcmD family protein
MVNIYLVLAYGFVWGIFMLYAWIIHNRQKRLEREIEELKHELGQPSGNPPKSQA